MSQFYPSNANWRITLLPQSVVSGDDCVSWRTDLWLMDFNWWLEWLSTITSDQAYLSYHLSYRPVGNWEPLDTWKTEARYSVRTVHEFKNPISNTILHHVYCVTSLLGGFISIISQWCPWSVFGGSNSTVRYVKE